MKQRRFKFFPQQIYDGLFLVLLIFVSNRRALVCWYVLVPEYYCEYGTAFTDYVSWGMLVLVAFLMAVQHKRLHEFWLGWRNNWLLALFILYSIISISWSIVPDRSIHTAYIMVTASIIGNLLAILYSPQQLIKILLWFTLLCGLFSLALVLALPGVGIHQERWLAEAWHGVFTHKNYLGSILALGNCLSLISFALASGRRGQVMNTLYYLFTLFMILMTRSATGLILWAVLNGLSVLFFVWTKWYAELQKMNRKWLLGLLASVFTLVAASISAIFLVMGRDLTLTGRVPLWQILLTHVVPQKPWFGYGLETLWYFLAFQIWNGRATGWGITVVNGHSGYMDMLIYLGVVGLVILLIFLAQGFVRAVRRALTSRTWLDFFPLLVFVYLLVVNITISYFLEFESFHWVLLTTLLFLPLGRLEESTSAQQV
ncbi:MAG: O-antigen ligase family protein [Chloroflexota bacterium]